MRPPYRRRYHVRERRRLTAGPGRASLGSVLHLWLKAAHLIAMVAWFAGTFYMFRLFVYHAENREHAHTSELLKHAAERLYHVIMTPAMLGTWAFGIAMILNTPEFLTRPWIWLKLLFVVGLSGYHGFVGRVRRRFADDDIFLSSRQCRLLNEVPTVLLIAIVCLAVLKPFG